MALVHRKLSSQHYRQWLGSFPPRERSPRPPRNCRTSSSTVVGRLSTRNIVLQCVKAKRNNVNVIYPSLFLCYVMLCYVMLCYVMLCYMVICKAPLTEGHSEALSA